MRNVAGLKKLGIFVLILALLGCGTALLSWAGADSCTGASEAGAPEGDSCGASPPPQAARIRSRQDAAARDRMRFFIAVYLVFS